MKKVKVPVGSPFFDEVIDAISNSTTKVQNMLFESVQEARENQRLARGKELRAKREAYMQTEAWKTKAAYVKARDNYTCQMCLKKDRPLDCHHLTYDRLGDEPTSDLLTLCRTCHNKWQGSMYYT
jgi:5-methylcytosine-specific restriction endonuclease McrA